MPVREHIAHVPYAQVVEHFLARGGWTCTACGGPVTFMGLGHHPQPRRPLFVCGGCERRSEGCQTFEGHHLLYGGCALDNAAPMRCGYWRGAWAAPRGECPICGASSDSLSQSTPARQN